MKNGKTFKVGDRLEGFVVTRVRESRETGGTFVEFEHEKTGAELAFNDCGEENKLFCVAFKTLPEDSTGVFHILEHSVLCGSGKFPVKEPFVDLLKSSMNTFLNAITFQDKTVYPVSSRNTKDFLNLTEVYLDAVFDPALLNNANIFRQEGHHIEQDDQGKLSYKGVVFNEMKGALSDVDNMVSEKMQTLLFPGSPYGVNSGGDPEHIPELTYEKFRETYKKYYHPSNSRIYLDGDVPLEETLKLIDSYLSRFERGVKIPDPDMSHPAGGGETIKYDLAKTEPTENRGILAMSRIIGTWKDKVKCMAARVIGDILLGSNFAPLKSKVLESGLAQDIYMYTDGSVLQPYSFILCRNVVDGKADELKKLICDIALEIAEKGIDRELLLPSISRYEFGVREQEEPRALRRVLTGLTGWLHGGDPLSYMEFDKDFAELRRPAEGGGFEAIVKEIFDGGEGLATILALPDHNEGDRLRDEENARLEAIGAAWTPEERAENAEMNRRLTAWQQTPDRPEDVAKIPVLDVSEVDPEPSLAPTEEKTEDGVKVLFHKIPSNGIVYANMYFNLSDFTLHELTILSRAGLFYGTLPTNKYGPEELQNEMKKRLGRFNASILAWTMNGKERRTTPMLCVSFSALESEYEGAAELAAEILTGTRFDDNARIREIALQNDENVKQTGVSAGHYLGFIEALAGYSSAGAVSEAISGRSMILYAHELAENFYGKIDELKTVFGKLAKAFVKERLVLSLTGTDEPDAGAIVSRLGNAEQGSVIPKDALYKADVPKRLGLEIPAQIGYAAQGYNFLEENIEYEGSFCVAAQIVSLDYLWNAVRVQGGAYGAGLSVNIYNMFTYSYRDPSPSSTLEVNRNIASYLRSLREKGESLDKYVISSLSEPLQSPRQMASGADNAWFLSLSRDMMRRHRLQGINTTWEDIERFCVLMEHFAEKGAVCVVAYKEALEKCGDLDVREL
ncbi:MAG: insulinase family protein [Clostridia bacterium]|nr:insulinase family protein [Clostridia bacterium]